MQDDRETRAPSAPDAHDERDDAAPEPAVRVDVTPPEDEEMGGEQPCQLHRFWDVPE